MIFCVLRRWVNSRYYLLTKLFILEELRAKEIKLNRGLSIKLKEMSFNMENSNEIEINNSTQT